MNFGWATDLGFRPQNRHELREVVGVDKQTVDTGEFMTLAQQFRPD